MGGITKASTVNLRERVAEALAVGTDTAFRLFFMGRELKDDTALVPAQLSAGYMIQALFSSGQAAPSAAGVSFSPVVPTASPEGGLPSAVAAAEGSAGTTSPED